MPTNDNKMQHPWVDAAEEFGLPYAIPSITRLQLITVKHESGNEEDKILFSIASATGVTTIFISTDDFAAFFLDCKAIYIQLLESKPTTDFANLPPSSPVTLVKGGNVHDIQKELHDNDHIKNIMRREQEGKNPF